MRIYWRLNNSETERIRALVKSLEKNPSYQSRIAHSLANKKLPVTQEQFWYWLVVCLISEHQQSQPGTPVRRFVELNPFPLSLDKCRAEIKCLNSFAAKVLRDFGGISQTTLLGDHIQRNLDFLESGGWTNMMALLENVQADQNAKTEREAANFISIHCQGFGAKLTRKLMHCLGFARYEIQIPIKLIKWLNQHKCPLRTDVVSLRKRDRYNQVLTCILQACDKIGILPCELASAILLPSDKAATQQ